MKLADRPVADWLADLFAVVDAERRKLCSAASGEGGDPPCWRVLPDAYKNEECSAGCGTRAILAALSTVEIDYTNHHNAAKCPHCTGNGKFVMVEADTILSLQEKVSRLEAALTPSGDTKADYHGEFSFIIKQAQEDDDGEAVEVDHRVYVPWTTVKEIMAAIRARAALSKYGQGSAGTDGGEG